MSNDKTQNLVQQIKEIIEDTYAERVRAKHPAFAPQWPIISGNNLLVGKYGDWTIIIFKHTGSTAMRAIDGLNGLTPEIVGVDAITHENKEQVRRRLIDVYGLSLNDVVVFSAPQGFDVTEFDVMMHRHERARGLAPMKIFLSHKSADKPLVRQYKQLLSDLGFDPWLDEDAMHAGVELERSLLKGFADSCAAIFFVTPNYKDENYLASEVDYAIQEKRKKGDRFQIITLVFSDNGPRGAVPELLRRYVYKEPSSDLIAFQEILRALPLSVGATHWRL